MKVQLKSKRKQSYYVTFKSKNLNALNYSVNAPIVKDKKTRGRPKSTPSPSPASSVNSDDSEQSFISKSPRQNSMITSEQQGFEKYARKTPRRTPSANEKAIATDTDRSPIKKKLILDDDIDVLSQSLFFTQPTLSQPATSSQNNQQQNLSAREHLRKAIRQLDVNMNFDFDNAEPLFIYHEQQRGAQCGLIALRNGFQIDYGLDEAYMYRVGEEMEKTETSSVGRFFVKDVGWYSSFLIFEVLLQLGRSNYNIKLILKRFIHRLFISRYYLETFQSSSI